MMPRDTFNVSEEEVLNDYRVVFHKNDHDGETYSLSARKFAEIIKNYLKGEIE